MVTKSSKEKNNNKPQQPSTLKLVLSFSVGALSLALLLVTLTVNPIVLFMRNYLSVKNGSFVHEMMYKDIEGIHLSAYLFNITNAEQFMAGEDQKLKIEEVGPFTYKETRKLEDVVLDFEKQLLFCTPRVSLAFVPEESIGYPEEVNVTMPNLPMLGVSSQLSSYPYIARMGFSMLTRQLKSKAIVKMDARTYLWGYNEPIVSIAHATIPGMINFEKIGVLDRLYGNKDTQNRLEASIADEDKFMVKSRNGYKKLQMSESQDPDECEKCSTFENSYEGVGFPAGLTPAFKFRIYRNGLCRILDMDFYGKKTMDYGGEALVYHFSDNFFTFNPNETNTGILVLPECFFGIPLAFSKPHLMGVDPKLYDLIEGVKPDAEKFEGYVVIDPIVGMSLETKFSLQVNLVLKDVSYNSETRRFSNMVLPICYVTIVQPALPEESFTVLHRMHIGKYIILGIQILLLIIGLFSWAYFSRSLCVRLSRKSEDVLFGANFPITTMTKPSTISNTEEPLMTSNAVKSKS